MADMTKCRELLKVVRELVTYLTDEEISDIGEVLMRATDRMLKEQENG